MPRFEDDSEFIPLQAADFWAWWNSHWLDTGHIDFEEAFEVYKGFQSANHFIVEGQAISILKKIVRHHVPNATIYEYKP